METLRFDRIHSTKYSVRSSYSDIHDILRSRSGLKRRCQQLQPCQPARQQCHLTKRRGKKREARLSQLSLLCDSSGAMVAHAKTPSAHPFSSTRIDLVGLPQPVPHTDKLPMARHGRKAMAGGCANGHAQWLGSPEPGAQQLKHEVKRKPPLQEDVCYRLMIHKPASCRVKTGRWVPNLSPEKCLLHGMALPGTSTPSIRPSGSLASPSMSLGADNTLEHPCRRRHPS
jgi:hypothetical protein